MKFILGDDKKIFEWGGMKLWWGESTGGNFILEGGDGQGFCVLEGLSLHPPPQKTLVYVKLCQKLCLQK